MKKVAHYRRAVWFSESPEPLAKVLIDGLEKIPEAEIPIFSASETADCVVARRAIKTQPIFLQFVTYEKGAPAAVIPEATSAEVLLNADTADPPEGKEYIQSQLFCVVSGNDVVWTTHNTVLREGAINSLFSDLIATLSGNDADTKFVLQAILDKSAFSKAFKAGIGEIDLGLGDFKSALESLTSGGKILGLSGLKSLIQNTPSTEEIAAAANLQGRLVLRPGRRWEKPHVKDLLSGMASSVLKHHENEFVIVTKNGLRLTKKKMSVHKEYEASGNRQILSPTDAETKLAAVLLDLKNAGLLEG